MKIVFRADASTQMGTGHIMRCLTLADNLAEQGAHCYFICREHTGNLMKMITERGHQVYSLPYNDKPQQVVKSGVDGELEHAAWLGATQQADAVLSAAIVQSLKPDWLIVDHYALDARWEKILRPYCHQLMVIDDLADRQHDCDLLLDQTFGRDAQDYTPCVPRHCQLLCGAQYALLRPEFAHWRKYSLQRRQHGQLEHLVINLGGVDKDNITTQILKALERCSLPTYCRITVVMGIIAPWAKQAQQQAALMPWPTEIKIGVSNMAELMANSDLAIGAAGATTWERCCLGLPTIQLVLAENQRDISSGLKKVGAAILLENISDLSSTMHSISFNRIRLLTQASKELVDGLGCQRVSHNIIGK